MIDESYITSLEERIKNLIQLTKNTYERLKAHGINDLDDIFK